MKILLGYFQFVLFLGAIFLFFAGIFYPKLIIRKSFIGRRLLLVFMSIGSLVLFGFIQEYKVNHVYSSEEREQYYADIHTQDSINALKKEMEQKKSTKNKNFVESKTITVLSDSAILLTYKPEFYRLYNKLNSMDSVQYVDDSRSDYHKKIQNLLFEKWWNAMESVDSTHASLPLSYKEYKKCSLLYDKQLARFVIYGDEDIDMINFWAEERAKTILKQTLRDPDSLVVENVICRGKTQKGWMCDVIYRATNGFGGYVREKITLIMQYDMENSLYKCVFYQ